MSDKLVTNIVAVGTAIIGLAIIAVILSNRANTSGTLTAAGKSFSQVLSCALSPITGAGCGTQVTSNISFQ